MTWNLPTVAHTNDTPKAPPASRVLVVGATGDIGRATVRALLEQGLNVTCIVRRRYDGATPSSQASVLAMLNGAEVRFAEVSDPASLAREGFRGERFDAVISCLASRTGAPDDAWAVDYQANLNVLKAARSVGASHFILLSALCVQKPRLAFQRAKLAFEDALVSSGLRYSIVRPTTFFKSLSGQIKRVQQGKPFLMFGDGRMTACKPISDGDLAEYITQCLRDETRWDRILPIGGPGAPITPREQGERIYALLSRPARFKSVPITFLDATIGALSLLGRISPGLAEKAEFARIGRYYATESMLVLDLETGRYNADATPSTGSQTLFDFYADIIAGSQATALGEHAFFDR